MNDKVSRIALVLLGLALSALALKALVGDGSADGRDTAGAGGAATSGIPGAPGTNGGSAAGSPGAAGGSGTGGDAETLFDPLAGGAPVAPAAGGTAQHAAARPPAMERRDVGPPLADGTPVDVSIHRRAGTVSRYRVSNAIAQRNRANGQSAFQSWAFDVTTKVMAVGTDGSARVRMTIDAVRVQSLAADGVPVDFDSRDPDEAALRDPARAISIKPLLAIVGIPVEFALAPNGGCTEIEGLDAWHEAWVDVVEELNPGSSRQAVPPYTRDTVLHEWSEVLFPPLLGGTLKAGETRDVQILRDTLQNAYIEFRGPLTVTHDAGGVFRMRMTTRPAMLPRQGGARSPQEAAVARVHVQADDDAYYAAWRFERDPGRLLDAEIDTKYQHWVAWNMGQDAQGNDSYERLFVDVERSTRVELLTE